MKVTILVMFIFFSKLCFGQQDSALSLIEDALRSREQIDKIVYLDGSLGYYKQFHEFVRKGLVTGYNGQQKVKNEIL